MPGVKDFAGLIWFNNNLSEIAENSWNGSNIIVDLSSSVYKVDTFVLLQNRTLLKLWQIILIVSAAGAVVVGVVVLFIRIRRKKKDMYSRNDVI